MHNNALSSFQKYLCSSITIALMISMTLETSLHAMKPQRSSTKHNAPHSSHHSPLQPLAISPAAMQQPSTMAHIPKRPTYRRKRPPRPGVQKLVKALQLTAEPREIICQMCTFWNTSKSLICALCENKLLPAKQIIPEVKSRYEEKEREDAPPQPRPNQNSDHNTSSSSAPIYTAASSSNSDCLLLLLKTLVQQNRDSNLQLTRAFAPSNPRQLSPASSYNADGPH